MNSVQRIIKYAAMALAVMLAVGIVTIITTVVINVISVISGKPFWDDKERIDFSKEFTDVKNLDISNSVGDLYIVVGETFRVEAINVTNSFRAEVSSGKTLTISDKNRNFLWFNFNGFHNLRSKITVYLPEDFVAGNVKLESGAGSVVIDALKTGRLTIDAGAGNIKGSNMVADKVKVDGGVGNITLTGISFEDADFDSGVGSLMIEGELLGDNRIDCGVGEVSLELMGRKEDYSLEVDSGVGTIRVDGEKISDIKRNRGAKHSIAINGGVGNVRINFNE